MIFEWLTSPEAWIALGTLTALEIVLGIDNIIFISILVGRLPESQRAFARRMGLGLAMITRLALLFSISWVMGLTEPWVTLFSYEISGRDVILIGGGLFLVAKATHEIHNSLEGIEEPGRLVVVTSLGTALLQIAVLDIVFSLDSVITAIGMVSQLGVMIAAVTAAVGVMLVLSGPIARFVKKHPTIKILALSFLIMIGTALVAESLDFHFPKNYIYFAMAFSVAVEFINIRTDARAKR